MQRRQYWLLGLGLLVALVVAIAPVIQPLSQWAIGSPPLVVAQSPPVPATPTRSPAITAPATPSPTSTTPASPTVVVPAPAPASPTNPATPSIPPLPPTPLPPTFNTPPLPLDGSYKDPAGRFAVGILAGCKVSPLAGSVLIESPDGNLAYAVVPQSQPVGNPLGLDPTTAADSLATVATTVFQRGERFQPGLPNREAGGGIVMNWTGALTIGGNTQPVNGVILVRPSPQQIVLLIVTATQTGAGQVPGAISALANSLQVF